LSDRSRYYWPVPAVAQALARLEAAFDNGTPPMALLHQYLPTAHAALRRGEIELSARALVVHQIRQVLAEYSRACDGAAAQHRGSTQ
jgi:D-tagatose-1,6-bisphosphate aldolase subunit GatZ/KbaZ